MAHVLRQLLVDGAGNVLFVQDADSPYQGPNGEMPRWHAYKGGHAEVVSLDPSDAYRWHGYLASDSFGYYTRGAVLRKDGNLVIAGHGFGEAPYTGPFGGAPLHPPSVPPGNDVDEDHWVISTSIDPSKTRRLRALLRGLPLHAPSACPSLACRANLASGGAARFSKGRATVQLVRGSVGG